MDDQRLGAMLRAARIRRGWRQVDVARRAAVSRSTVSRLERGHVGSSSLDAIRSAAAALEIRIELLPRSRGGDLDRLVNARHADLAESVLARFATLPGWVARPEVSFNAYGERGVVDILAWHPARRALLVIELKTEIVDVGEVLGTFDRKRRLAMVIAEPLGWRPLVVGAWLIVGDSRTNRRRIAAHRATFTAALPANGRTVRAWLSDPAGPLLAASMWTDAHGGTARPRFSTPRRVRTSPARSA